MIDLSSEALSRFASRKLKSPFPFDGIGPGKDMLPMDEFPERVLDSASGVSAEDLLSIFLAYKQVHASGVIPTSFRSPVGLLSAISRRLGTNYPWSYYVDDEVYDAMYTTLCSVYDTPEVNPVFLEDTEKDDLDLILAINMIPMPDGMKDREFLDLPESTKIAYCMSETFKAFIHPVEFNTRLTYNPYDLAYRSSRKVIGTHRLQSLRKFYSINDDTVKGCLRMTYLRDLDLTGRQPPR